MDRSKSKEPGPSQETPDPPDRWSEQRKADLILRLLRGESLDSVSRESQVPAHELESWQRTFLEGGTRGLKRHTQADDR